MLLLLLLVSVSVCRIRLCLQFALSAYYTITTLLRSVLPVVTLR